MHIRGSCRDGFRGAGLRWGQLLALSGLTGFAVSQPLLAVAGDNPSMFTFADVQGWRLFAFALAVAVVPPVVLWVLVLIAGAVGRRAGDVAFLAAAAVLVGLAVVQWVKLAGFDQRVLVGAVAITVAGAFGWALMRLPAATTFTRYTAVLPAVAVASFVLSPTGDLLRGAPAALAGDGSGVAPVVFIMVDELPTLSILDGDRNVDAGRLPNLAEFAQDATWYRDFTTKAPKTLQAVPSMLTGREPVEDNSGLWTNHPDNLFDLLAPTHHLEAHETITQLCGYSTCEPTGTRSAPGLGQVFREIGGVWRQRVSLDPIGPPEIGQFEEEATPLGIEDRRSADGSVSDAERLLQRPDQVSDVLDSLAQPTGVSLHYLHLLLPHQPWVHYPDGTTYALADELSEAALPEVTAPDWGVVQLEQAHLLQTEYTDRLLGQIFDTLRSTGRYDESLIVVTADHGVAFRSAQNLRGVDDPANLPGVAYVPLFIKEPGQTEGRIDDSNLMGPDLLPTIADVLGMEVPDGLDGLAAGDPRITDRGDRKEIYDFGNEFLAAEFQGIVEFDSSSRPSADMRWTGTADASEQPLAGLFAHLGLEEYLGADPAELPVAAGGTAGVAALDAVSSPPPGDAALGYLRGELADEPGDGTLLVALDGEITSTSPVAEGAFRAPLPPPDEDGTRGDVELLHVVDDEIHRLDVESLE